VFLFPSRKLGLLIVAEKGDDFGVGCVADGLDGIVHRFHGLVVGGSSAVGRRHGLLDERFNLLLLVGEDHFDLCLLIARKGQQLGELFQFVIHARTTLLHRLSRRRAIGWWAAGAVGLSP